MINARAQLYRQMQEMFETHLRGRFAWSGVEHLPAEKVAPVDGRTRFPLGKLREIVSIRFGAFDLTVSSPEEAPPLGQIRISGPRQTLEEDSLDPSAWDRVGKFIASQHERFAVHV